MDALAKTGFSLSIAYRISVVAVTVFLAGVAGCAPYSPSQPTIFGVRVTPTTLNPAQSSALAINAR
jgi:hypothetical protein